jgi:hypothetical protein
MHKLDNAARIRRHHCDAASLNHTGWGLLYMMLRRRVNWLCLMPRPSF